MSPEQALTIGQYLIGLIEMESATTRRVLAAVPDQGSDYKPDAKSMSGADLAFHIAAVDIWFLEGIINGGFSDPGGEMPPAPKPSETLAMYDAQIPGLIAKLKGLTGEQLAKETKFYIWNNPMVMYLSFYMNHCIHHRGQLSAYLRAMGSKVPKIYGGSADEPMEMPQGASA